MLLAVRHGERADMAGKEEIKRMEIPYDPHLTKVGCQQAIDRGKKINKILADYSEKTGKKIKPILMTSPFLRTIMTTFHIASQLENIYENTIFLQEHVAELLYTGDFSSDPLKQLYILENDINKYIDLKTLSLKLAGNFFEDSKLPKAVFPESLGTCDKRVKIFMDSFEKFFFDKFDIEEYVPIIVSHRYVIESSMAELYFKAKNTNFDYCGMLHVEYQGAPKDPRKFKVLQAGV